MTINTISRMRGTLNRIEKCIFSNLGPKIARIMSTTKSHSNGGGMLRKVEKNVWGALQIHEGIGEGDHEVSPRKNSLCT
jgi:hypothetical protein